LGAGVDIVTACDIRYCSSDAVFSVKEVDVGLAADLGSLQRLPSIIGHGSAMELALTARTFSAEEAHRLKLVTAVEDSKEDVLARAMRTALELAKKSPVAITGTKRVLVHTRDNNVPSGLEFIAVWNSAMLRSSDMTEVFAARMEKRQPTYAALINSKL